MCGALGSTSQQAKSCSPETRQLTSTAAALSLAAHSNPITPLLEIDIADLSKVTITATGASPSQDGSGYSTFSGISLLGIFTANESSPGILGGTLTANGDSGAYNYASVFYTGDLNLWCLGCGFETQDFVTTDLAFTGIATLDLTGFSIQGAGSFGDIEDDDFRTGVIIGQWAIVDSSTITATSAIPEPSSFALLGLGMVGLCIVRQKSKLPMSIERSQKARTEGNTDQLKMASVARKG